MVLFDYIVISGIGVEFLLLNYLKIQNTFANRQIGIIHLTT